MLIVFLSVGVIGSLIAIVAIKVGITLEAKRNEKARKLPATEMKQTIKTGDDSVRVLMESNKEKDITIK